MNEIHGKERGRTVTDTTLNGRNRDRFTAVKVPRQYPVVFIVKAGSRDNTEGRGKGSGATRKNEQGLTAFDRNYEF
jgi:uncharacterized protein Veg